MTLFDYAKLNKKEKEIILKHVAIMVEQYGESNNQTQIYFLNDFFVEVTIQNGKMIENIPFKRGFRFPAVSTQELRQAA